MGVLLRNDLVRRMLPAVVGVAALAVTVRWHPFPAPLGVLVSGALTGGRIALIALGLALVWRTNRVISFAQADLGGVPAMLAVLLVVGGLGLNYFVGFGIGLVAAIVLGALVELLIVRRFFRASRLALTVATIGLAQVLIALSLFLPGWMGADLLARRIEPPFTIRFELGGTFFNATDVITMVAVPALFVGLAWFLRRSDIGIAARAGAESVDRAVTLGIPVRRVHTYVWVVAAVLGYVSLFLRAGSVGLPIGTVLGPAFLLQALGAAVLGGMDRLPTIAISAIGIGVLDQAMTYQPANQPAYNDVMVFAVILVGLLIGREHRRRQGTDDTAGWQAAREVRPIPPELSRLPEVIAGRVAVGVAVAAVLLTLPLWMSTSRINLAALVALFSIVAVSLVVLTGWAGHVSLGHVAFVAIGAAVGGALTSRLHWDLGFALLAAGAAGAVVAVIIAAPALRRKGLTLAVSTLGLALVVPSWLLDRNLFDNWLPASRITRARLFGVIDTENETTFYFVSLAALLLAAIAARGIRTTRTGRVLVGARDNEHAARAHGVATQRAALVACAFSGFLAAAAGALYVQHQHGLSASAFSPQRSLEAFSMVVIGGLGSITGAVLGAIYVRGLGYFLPPAWQLLSSGAGLLIVLWILPGGIGAALAEVRDAALRRVARRRGLVVASLLADVRIDDASPEPVVGDDTDGETSGAGTASTVWAR